MANIFDDEGVSHSRDDLKLGMLTEVFASPLITTTTGATATAAVVRYGSQIIGPVDSVDLPTTTLVVLGQSVRVTTSTVFDASIVGGLAGLVAPTDIVEVFAQLDVNTQTYVATRIERHNSATLFKLRGVISALSTVDKTITVGGQLISYANVAPSDPIVALKPGTIVRVTLQTMHVDPAWVAMSLMTGIGPVADRDTAEVDGRIGAFTSMSQFVVNGITVDASNATLSPSTATLALGTRVEVEGSIRNGVLLASKVKVEGDGESGFELEGKIASPDAIAMTFVVRGVTVVYSASTRFDTGKSAADIKVGLGVEVQGALSSDGTRLEAASIHFDN
jgi:hypothetical protein